jgi:hypothetical protein
VLPTEWGFRYPIVSHNSYGVVTGVITVATVTSVYVIIAKAVAEVAPPPPSTAPPRLEEPEESQNSIRSTIIVALDSSDDDDEEEELAELYDLTGDI